MVTLPGRSDSLKNPARSERQTVLTKYRSLCLAIESLVQMARLSGTAEDYGGKNGFWITREGTPGAHSNKSRMRSIRPRDCHKMMRRLSHAQRRSINCGASIAF